MAKENRRVGQAWQMTLRFKANSFKFSANTDMSVSRPTVTAQGRRPLCLFRPRCYIRVRPKFWGLAKPPEWNVGEEHASGYFPYAPECLRRLVIGEGAPHNPMTMGCVVGGIE